MAEQPDMMESFCLDPVEREEPDSQKLTVDWAMNDTAVAPVLKEVFGAGHSLEHYEFQHEKHGVHLQFKCQEFIEVQEREGGLEVSDLNCPITILEMFVSDVWADHLRWMKDRKECECKDGHRPVWTFRCLGFENYEKKTLLEVTSNKESSDCDSHFRLKINSSTTLGGFRNKIMKADDFVESLESEDGRTAFWLKKMDGTDFESEDDDVKLVELAPFKAFIV